GCAAAFDKSTYSEPDRSQAIPSPAAAVGSVRAVALAFPREGARVAPVGVSDQQALAQVAHGVAEVLAAKRKQRVGHARLCRPP
ncbi:MAG TPA: hypothetical protein VIW26_15585, partial [Gemmatimonadales bacterium]